MESKGAVMVCLLCSGECVGTVLGNYCPYCNSYQVPVAARMFRGALSQVVEDDAAKLRSVIARIGRFLRGEP